MTFVIKTGVVLLLVCFVSAQQRVAPGVPPQQYQQQHGQMHPAPPQYQQQYQQVPVQPQYQQAGYQQQPPQGGYHEQPQQAYQQQPQQHQQQIHQPQQQQPQGHHGHHGHQAGQPVLNTGNIKEERAHIAEHMDVPIDTSKMTEQELQFHYFKMHDSDNNNKLDGCELIKSLIHWHEDSDTKGMPSTKSMTDEEISDIVDSTLSFLDKDKDGYVTYTEYKMAAGES